MLNSKPVILFAVVVMNCLSGCTAVDFDPTFGILTGWQAARERDKIIEATTVCPPLVDYEQDFLDRAAVEIEQLPAGAVLVSIIEDYGRLRQAIRAC